MIAQMSKNAASFFVARGIVHREDFEVYAYSFEIIISRGATSRGR